MPDDLRKPLAQYFDDIVLVVISRCARLIGQQHFLLDSPTIDVPHGFIAVRNTKRRIEKHVQGRCELCEFRVAVTPEQRVPHV
ncbi:hypothetical protein WJ40_31590 [Burkholderia cepacia]|nr:hypothetical protein WI25_22215 [Burkholderia cepacia]KVH56301.1 hypothetical protein WJ40_31590 [Burkholderia cepacia]